MPRAGTVNATKIANARETRTGLQMSTATQIETTGKYLAQTANISTPIPTAEFGVSTTEGRLTRNPRNNFERSEAVRFRGGFGQLDPTLRTSRAKATTSAHRHRPRQRKHDSGHLDS